ncbi:MAG: hypothetical protein ACKOC5_10490 [Chloroflexota bacterium]
MIQIRSDGSWDEPARMRLHAGCQFDLPVLEALVDGVWRPVHSDGAAGDPQKFVYLAPDGCVVYWNHWLHAVPHGRYVKPADAPAGDPFSVQVWLEDAWHKTWLINGRLTVL